MEFKAEDMPTYRKEFLFGICCVKAVLRTYLPSNLPIKLAWRPRLTPPTKDRETTPTKDLETGSTKDLQTSSAKDLEMASTKDLETASAKDLETASAKDLETASAKDLETASAKDLETASAKDLETASAEDLETASAEDLETASAKDLETASTKDLETASAKKRKTPSAKKRKTPSKKRRKTPSKKRRKTPSKKRRKTPSKKKRKTPSKKKIKKRKIDKYFTENINHVIQKLVPKEVPGHETECTGKLSSTVRTFFKLWFKKGRTTCNDDFREFSDLITGDYCLENYSHERFLDFCALISHMAARTYLDGADFALDIAYLCIAFVQIHFKGKGQFSDSSWEELDKYAGSTLV